MYREPVKFNCLGSCPLTMVVRSGSEYYSVAYQLPVKHCDCMLVRGEAEKPGQRLHRFRVLALGRARMADALHDYFF